VPSLKEAGFKLLSLAHTGGWPLRCDGASRQRRHGREVCKNFSAGPEPTERRAAQGAGAAARSREPGAGLAHQVRQMVKNRNVDHRLEPATASHGPASSAQRLRRSGGPQAGQIDAGRSLAIRLGTPAQEGFRQSRPGADRGHRCVNRSGPRRTSRPALTATDFARLRPVPGGRRAHREKV